MRHFLSHLRRHRRRLFLALFAAAMFLLWFGVWGRVMGIRPRVVIPLTDQLVECYGGLDGKTLITRTRRSDGSCQIQTWEAVAGHLVATHGSDDFRILETGDGTCILLERTANPQLWDSLHDPPASHYWHPAPDGKTLAFNVGGSGPRIYAWDIPNDRMRFELYNPIGRPPAFSSDGKMLAYTRYSGELSVGLPEIAVVDAESGRTLKVLHGLEAHPNELRFSPDGKLLAAGYWVSPADRFRVKVWSMNQQREVAQLNRSGYISFSSDGRHLACIRDSELVVWDTDSWEERIVRAFPEQLRAFGGPVFIPNTALLLMEYTRMAKRDGNDSSVTKWFASPGGAISLYWVIDTTSGREYGPITRVGRLSEFVLLPNSQSLALLPNQGPNEIHLYDLPPRRPIGLYLLFSALPTLVFTGVLWWRVG
jgi:WD40 repeat protein